MPLSKARMRDRKRQDRSNLVKPTERGLASLAVKPNQDEVRRKLAKEGINLTGNRASLAPQSKSSPLKEESNSRLPRYNKAIHRAGDRVLMTSPVGKLIEVVVPELDADGNQVW